MSTKRKSVKNAAISVVVLLIIFVGGGIIYTYFMDQDAKPLKQVSAKTYTEPQVAKATPPDPKEPERVAAYLSSPQITPVSNETVTARTLAGSKCTILVSYAGAQSMDSGLVPKIADQYGTVSWTWTVGPTVPIGSWPIKITCVFNGRTAVVDTTLPVVKQ